MSKHPRCLQIIGAGIFCVISTNLYSAGFAIIENSGSGTGTAYAGAAANAQDPSSIWFNPASMIGMSGQRLSIAGHVVNVGSKFTNKGTSTNPLLGGDDIVGSEGDPGGAAFIPNLYYVKSLSPDMSFGLSVNAPFGLETKYDKDWVGRYQAVRSAILSININPALAWRMSDELSLGAGISAQYVHATLTSAIDSGSVCLGSIAPAAALNDPNTTLNGARAECVKAGLTPANLEHDSFGDIEGDSWAFNFNVGLLYRFNPQTRIGLAYRSKIDHELEGKADFTVDPALQQFLTAGGSTAFTDTDVKADANLPASLSLSVAHQLDDKIQILGDITWSQWSSFEELRVEFDNPAQPDSFTDQSWEDVVRYSVGLSYQHSDIWKFRAGLAYDEEPIPSLKFRTPRIPGNDRIWLAFGAGYKISDKMNIDFAYAHLFIDETAINHTDESLGHTTRGLFDPKVDIISAQLNWHFD